MKIEGELKLLLRDALNSLLKSENLSLDELPDPIIEQPRVEGHGDYASNLALVVSKKLGRKPRDIAESLKTIILAKEGIVESMNVAGPGFVNFFLKRARYIDLLDDVCKGGDDYGRIDFGKGERLQIEFVSANPTGPLHVGHGRGAIYGDAVANVLKMAGYDVSKEYYLNDAGNQIETLGRSVTLRLGELAGETIAFPEDCYQGAYITDIATEIKASDDFAAISKMSEDEKKEWCGRYAGDKILDEIREDLKACGVELDTYFSEKTLHEGGKVDQTMETLKKKGYAYESEGALWFKSTDFGDEKDRVLKKSSGDYTYFAADIAYHLNKFERGFSRLIDVWGADHGGHVLRMKAAMEALGYNPDKLDLVLIQLVNLLRRGEMVSMSTRKATYETLKSLIDDVGKDVCRYFFLMRSHNAQLDFDLELARKQSPENPVYYIQYAHARICSVFRKAKEEKIFFKPEKINLNLLDLEEESKMARFLGEFPAVIRDAASSLEPHKVAFYLLELARMFQSYYSKARKDDRYKVIDGPDERIQSKLYLLKNIQIVVKNGLNVLGIDAPREMLREETDAGI